MNGHFAQRARQLLHQDHIDLQRRIGNRRGAKPQHRLNLAPFQARRDALAHLLFEAAQILGQADEGLEITVIDGADLPHQFAKAGAGGFTGKSGHAANHWQFPFFMYRGPGPLGLGVRL